MGINRLGAIPGAAGAVVVLMLLSGCVTYPYQTAFTTCDDAAGACYRYCEQFAGDALDYSACHADCDAEADRCFANAYDRYNYSSAYASTGYSSWPWYGRYGRWGPRQGYYFDFTYFERYPRYRDRYPRYRDRRGRHGDRGGRRRGDDDGGRRPRRGNPSGGDNTAPPPSAPPPRSTPPRTSPPPSTPPRSTPPPQRRTAPPARTKPNTTTPRSDPIDTDPE